MDLRAASVSGQVGQRVRTAEHLDLSADVDAGDTAAITQKLEEGSM
jgi:hypothetical protein